MTVTNGGEIFYQGRGYALQHAKGSATTGGDREMIAASTGSKHVVICIVTNGAGTATLKSDSTALSHVLAATSQMTFFKVNPNGWWETAAGEALNLTTSATVLWDLWYITVPV
jgi:hypothetical protein